MDTLITFVKVITLAQIVLLLIFLILSYGLKFYYCKRDEKAAKTKAYIHELLYSHFNQKESFTKKEILRLKKQVNQCLITLSQLEKEQGQRDYFQFFADQLSELVLKPMARKWSSSRAWHKRNEASLAYNYGFDPEDEANLVLLLKDQSNLIVLNAASVILKFNNKKLINEMGSMFAEKRRLEQSLLLSLIANFGHENLCVLETTEPRLLGVGALKTSSEAPDNNGREAVISSL